MIGVECINDELDLPPGLAQKASPDAILVPLGIQPVDRLIRADPDRHHDQLRQVSDDAICHLWCCAAFP